MDKRTNNDLQTTTQTIINRFGLTRPEIEPTIYRTGDEHMNHCTTDAVFFK